MADGIGLGQFLTVGAILFTLGVFGIFLNRKNIIIILMSVELILLAVNINFVAFSAVLFAAWALFAAWRSMARELREPPWWWGWPAFAAFCAIWAAGIHGPAMRQLGATESVAIASVVLVFATYLGLALDPFTRMKLIISALNLADAFLMLGAAWILSRWAYGFGPITACGPAAT